MVVRYAWGLRVVIVVCIALATGCASCNQGEGQNASEASDAEIFAELERANRLAADRSQMKLEGYIRRKGLEGMQLLPNGLFVRVKGCPLGPQFAEGERAKVAYRLELLDGTFIWEIDSTRAETLMLGARDRTAGLDMLVAAMAPGQQAIGLIPSRLGYGLRGDGSRIPPHACLVYSVTWVRRLP